MTTDEITLAIQGDGDVEQFKRDLLEMANGDPDWTVRVVDDES